MLDRIKTLTRDEITRLHDSYNEALFAPGIKPSLPEWNTTWSYWPEDWPEDWNKTWNAHWPEDWLESWSEAWEGAWEGAWCAAQSAVLAVSARHLIGQHGFALEHYNILTKPWRDVIGEFEEQPLLP